MNTLQLAKIKQHLLQEIGENTAKPYDWKTAYDREDKDGYKITKYTFDAPISEDTTIPYIAIITRDAQWDDEQAKLIYTVAFGIMQSMEYTSFSATSRDAPTGDWRRVMATIIDIIEKKILTDSYPLENELEEYTIQIHPTKQDETDNRRLNLYMQYIKKNMPSDASVYHTQDEDGLDVIDIVIPTKEIY